MTTEKMIAVGPIKRHGKIIAPGTRFDCDADVAARLMASGSAHRASEPRPAAGGDGGDGGEEERAARIDAIRAAVANLEAEDPDKANELLWKQNGEPRKRALTDRLEFEPTAEELAESLSKDAADG
ncbi:MAG: hypothetical protein M5U09_18920 [Gammaproteobacteria bacterium]|nr:hypothetical protein [Gammaproteobacteria bacterium]